MEEQDWLEPFPSCILLTMETLTWISGTDKVQQHSSSCALWVERDVSYVAISLLVVGWVVPLSHICQKSPLAMMMTDVSSALDCPSRILLLVMLAAPSDRLDCPWTCVDAFGVCFCDGVYATGLFPSVWLSEATLKCLYFPLVLHQCCSELVRATSIVVEDAASGPR
jgi:hypothetical protein